MCFISTWCTLNELYIIKQRNEKNTYLLLLILQKLPTNKNAKHLLNKFLHRFIFYAQTYLTYRRFQMTVINGIAEFLFLFIYKFFSLNNRNNFWKGHILLPYYQSAKKKFFFICLFYFQIQTIASQIETKGNTIVLPYLSPVRA